jgi:adenylylsulfate kinase-like enzyme
MNNGFCIWLTGLSASGKTTIAHGLLRHFESDRHIEAMDSKRSEQRSGILEGRPERAQS